MPERIVERLLISRGGHTLLISRGGHTLLISRDGHTLLISCRTIAIRAIALQYLNENCVPIRRNI